MTAFKPTHRLQNGAEVELEYSFICRHNGCKHGLFHFMGGSYDCYPMSYATELPKVLQVAAHEEPGPLLVAPAVGTEYWVVSQQYEGGLFKLRWLNDETDRRLLAAGEVRATKEDALAARAARQKARGFA